MHRGKVQIIPSRRRQAARKVCVCLGALALICGAVAQVTPASATPLPGSTSDCSYSNAATPVNSAALLQVTPGSTITISCAAGSLQASSTVVIVEASGLAGIVSPSSDQINDIDLSAFGVASTGADGSLSTTFTVPTTFSASDTNAACPPTQAQINAGLTCDLVLISLSGLQPVNEAMLVYQGQGKPHRPTLRASVSVHHGLKTVSVSDARGACPTPPTARSRCWWGAATTGSPNPGFSGIPAPVALLGGHITSGTLQVSPAVYCQTGATAAACASVPVGTLVPPALSGTITTRHGIGPFLTIEEPNATPYPGNGFLPPLISLTRNVSATTFVPFIRH
jgi:hypothetical protein